MPFNDFLYRPWNPKTDQDFENGPCAGNCHSYLAMDECDGFTVWNCCHGHWIMPRERSQCDEADANTHPLLIAAAQAFRAQEDAGMTWGDIAEDDYRTELAAETPAQKLMRLNAEAAAEAKANQAIINLSASNKASKWTKGGQMKFRVPKPCKYATLFLERKCANCSAHVPEGQTKCSAKKGHLVCGQAFEGCWVHEQQKNCIYVHPDEPQWADACSGALCVDPNNRLRFFVKGAEPIDEACRDFRGLSDKRPRHEERSRKHERKRPEMSAW